MNHPHSCLRTLHSSLWLSLLPISVLLLPACGAQTDSTAHSGSSTSFLEQCDTDDDCGDLSCICGRCTVPCDTNSECRDLDEEASCGVPRDVGLTCDEVEEEKACIAPELSEGAEPEPQPEAEPEPTAEAEPSAEPQPEVTDIGTEPTPDPTETAEGERCAPVVASPSVECAEQFCYPERLDIVVDDASGDFLHCTAPEDVEACTGTDDYVAFLYVDDSIRTHVYFDPSLVGNYTAEGVKAAFSYVSFELYVADGGLTYTEETQPVRAGDAALTNLDYVNGKLELSVDLGGLDGIARQVETKHYWCFVGGIDCDCTYDMDPMPTTVTLSLPLEGG